MDLVDTLRNKIQVLGDEECVPGLRAVLLHIETRAPSQHLIDKISWARCKSRLPLNLSPAPNSACIYLSNRSLNVRATPC